MQIDRSASQRFAGCFLPLLLAAAMLTGCSDDPDDEAPSHADASSRTFYVSPDGDDSASGLREAEAWRSIARVNRESFEPGDAILLEAGAEFEGTLKLDSADSGNAHAPVRVASFGDGRAVISAGARGGITITDASFIAIERLVITGNWDSARQAGNDGEGVSAVGTASGRRRAHLRLHELEVRGFKRAGIGLHARPDDEAKASGYEDVVISDCEVHDNGDFGVLTDGPYTYEAPGYSHARVRVRGVRAHHNRGLADKGQHTGSGIVLSDVEDAVIEHSIAHHNGELNDHAGGGGFGIWAWDSDRVVIAWNESYDNRTMTADGGGFDLDGGVTRSVIQFNYSHGNQGAGFGAFQFEWARPYSENLIQYNISQDDGFGFLVWDGNGDMGSLGVANNVAYGAKPAVVTYSALSDVAFVDNVFYGVGPKLLDIYAGAALKLFGNDYWTAEQPFEVAWNTGTGAPATYTSFDAFRSATGVETLDGEVTGLHADPRLVAAGSGPTLDDTSRLASLSMYQLQPDSPLIDRGVDPARFELDAADHDFFGAEAPQGVARDIGAHELR